MLGPSDSSRILLILDLDETLIHARQSPLDRPADFQLYGYHIYRRPFLDEFIANCAEHFDLAVWSSASDDYVRGVVQAIFPEPHLLRFVWGRSRATLRRLITDDFGYGGYSTGHMNYLKPLHKVARMGWDLRRVLIVDDSPEKLIRNYGNAIYPAPYEGHAEDRELKLLARYLETLRDCQNVRSVEKRTWRSSISGE